MDAIFWMCWINSVLLCSLANLRVGYSTIFTVSSNKIFKLNVVFVSFLWLLLKLHLSSFKKQ